MDIDDVVRRVPSERLRSMLSAVFRVTSDPVPNWLRPGQSTAAVVLFVGFAGLLFLPATMDLWFALITLGALASLVLRLLSLRWAPALQAGPSPQPVPAAEPDGTDASAERTDASAEGAEAATDGTQPRPV